MQQRLYYFYRLLFISITCVAIQACHLYKHDVRQGNYVTQAIVDQLQPGQSKAEVQRIMGTPILAPIFKLEQLQYDYYFKPGIKGKKEHKTLRLYFENNKLASYSGDWYIANLPKIKQLNLRHVDDAQS